MYQLKFKSIRRCVWMIISLIVIVLAFGLHAQGVEKKAQPKHKESEPVLHALSQPELVSFEIPAKTTPLIPANIREDDGGKKQSAKSDEPRITSNASAVWQTIMSEAFADAFLKIITGILVMFLRLTRSWFRAKLSRLFSMLRLPFGII